MSSKRTIMSTNMSSAESIGIEPIQPFGYWFSKPGRCRLRFNFPYVGPVRIELTPPSYQNGVLAVILRAIVEASTRFELVMSGLQSDELPLF